MKTLRISLSFLSLALFSQAWTYTPYPGNHEPHNTTTLPLPNNLTNATLHSLPQTFSPTLLPQDPTALGQIRQTLSLYPLCIDGKAFPSLNLVFTENAVANYSSPFPILTPLSTIASALEQSLSPVTTQHHLGTQVIELFGENTARSVTYFTANHFGKGKFEGEVVYGYGQYRDLLVRIEDGGWRVRERTLAYMGPLIGNLSIFTA